MNLVIQNKYCKATFETKGAELVSWQYQNHELIWNANEPWKRHAPILFPIVGKLLNDTYIYKNNTYHLTQHGFARDVQWLCTLHTNDTIEFELTDNDYTLQHYPFHFSLIILYKLIDTSLHLTFKVFNPSHKNLPFSIGYHPAFHLPHPIQHYFLKFYPPQKQIVSTLLHNGLITQQKNTIPLHNSALPLHTQLFDNDAIVLENTNISKIELYTPNENFSICIQSDKIKNWGIWTKPRCQQFICIEPWIGIADSKNHNQQLEQKKDIVLLPPYQSFEWKIIIEIKNKL
ncbi:MAG: aldose 1-epimerase family protein [Bacteroidetes bacterium]|nr:MAG: aldose 1-epimerase family protein [Bacteroidota bacterium]